VKIYAGNLAANVTEEDLRTEFTAFGKVDSVSVITDKYSGSSKGFAFIEMPVVSEGQAAIAALNGKALKERTITVNVARPRSDDRGSFNRDRRSGGFDRGRGRRY